MVWEVGMSGEDTGTVLLSEGQHRAVVTGVELIKESKSGNPYFLWKLMTGEGPIEMRTTLIKGKRWLLKQTLMACGIVANENDPEEKYVFSEKDVIKKTISIMVINQKQSFVGREGYPIEVERSQVNRVLTYKESKSTPLIKNPSKTQQFVNQPELPPEEEMPEEVDEIPQQPILDANTECSFRDPDRNLCKKLKGICMYHGKVLTYGPQEWMKCNYFEDKIPFDV